MAKNEEMESLRLVMVAARFKKTLTICVEWKEKQWKPSTFKHTEMLKTFFLQYVWSN